jgi:MtN3 and saliva related transmembrane protein
MIWELVGLAATLCVLASYLPQILRSYRTREMDDISLSYLSIIAVGIFLWLMYGIHIQDGVIIWANAFILSFALSLVLMKLRYSGKF